MTTVICLAPQLLTASVWSVYSLTRYVAREKLGGVGFQESFHCFWAYFNAFFGFCSRERFIQGRVDPENPTSKYVHVID